MPSASNVGHAARPTVELAVRSWETLSPGPLAVHRGSSSSLQLPPAGCSLPVGCSFCPLSWPRTPTGASRGPRAFSFWQQGTLGGPEAQEAAVPAFFPRIRRAQEAAVPDLARISQWILWCSPSQLPGNFRCFQGLI